MTELKIIPFKYPSNKAQIEIWEEENHEELSYLYNYVMSLLPNIIDYSIFINIISSVSTIDTTNNFTIHKKC